MPKVSRFFIKTGLLFFLLAIILRLLLDAFDLLPSSVLRIIFWHALMLGWITQIIMGVSTWMFPGRTKQEGFKAQKLAWLTYFCLNSGLIIRFIASPLTTLSQAFIWNWLLAISAILQFAAVLFFVMEMWPRILSKKQQIAMRKQKRKKRKAR